MAIVRKRKKGKILRIKEGYNPNSSSVGSQIPYLFAFYAGTGILAILTLHLFNRFKKIIKFGNHKSDRKDPDEQ